VAQNPPPGYFAPQNVPPQNWPPTGAPQPPRKRKLTGLWIALGVVALLCCGGLGVGGFFLVKGVNDATKPVRAAAVEYLDAVEVANYPRAYELLCSSLRGQVTAKDVESASPEIDHYKITTVTVANDNGVKSGTVVARITTQGDTSTLTIKLVKEAGSWRVCGT
jgi:hypothetical protein